MLRRGRQICRKVLSGSERGATFVEILIAIVILGAVVASVPAAIIFSTNAVFALQEQTVAEMLARSQMEYVKGCDYIQATPVEPDPAYAVVPVPDDTYEVAVTVECIDIDDVTGGHVGYLDPGEDEGMQEITVEIKHVDQVVVTTRCYKIDR